MGRRRAGPEGAGQDNETKQRLEESALHLFSHKGYAATSIREIIERAGVTRPVLYYYYESKEAMFRRLLESRFEAFSRDLEEALAKASTLRESLRAMAWTTFQHAEQSPEAVRLILQTFFAPRLDRPDFDEDSLWEPRFNRIRALMEAARLSNEVTAGDPEILARAFCGLIDMHVMAKCRKPLFRLTRSLADDLVMLFLEGAWPRAPKHKPI